MQVGGALRCLGSAQRLRSNYGHGYQIEVGFVIFTPEQIEERATQLFPTFGMHYFLLIVFITDGLRFNSTY